MGKNLNSNANNIVFIDRDGVIIEEVFRQDGTFGSIRKLEDLVLKAGILELCSFFQIHGIQTIAVSNQPDLGRNLVDEEFVYKVNNFLLKRLNLNYFLWCPHTELDNCNCRKPKTEMINFIIDNRKGIRHIFFIGDRDTDMEVSNKLNFIGIHLISKKGFWCQDSSHLHAENLGEIEIIIRNFISQLK